MTIIVRCAENCTESGTEPVTVPATRTGTESVTKTVQDLLQVVEKNINSLGYIEVSLSKQVSNKVNSKKVNYDAHPSMGSRCDSSLEDSSQRKDDNNAKQKRIKKEKKPVDRKRAEDAALVRKIFQARYQRAYGMVYSSWNGKQIGQAHAFVNQLRQIFDLVDDETVDMVICGYFANKYSWCGDSEPGTVKTIGFMSTSGNIQDAVSLMQRIYENSKPETEKELKYVERLATIRRFSEDSGETGKSREASDEPTSGDQGV